jgi:hypothetical protein
MLVPVGETLRLWSLVTSFSAAYLTTLMSLLRAAGDVPVHARVHAQQLQQVLLPCHAPHRQVSM